MALDSDFFSLDRAIGLVWDGNPTLDERTKYLVRYCLRDAADRPHGEEDLDQLQLVVSACDVLARTGGGEMHWLSDHGKLFPDAVKKFLYQTSLCFHQRSFGLPLEFTEPLASFLHRTNSHLATLNYDNLLYQPMIEHHVLDGYRGALVDGFLGNGFSELNLERRFGNVFGYYMHLHGCPLFVDRDSQIMKLRQVELGEDDDIFGSHIVLTHVKHKETVIAASPLLSCYWTYLAKALSESQALLLFGYSGRDNHLNSLLHSRSPATIRVVEWTGAGSEPERQRFWFDVLGREVDLARLDNILDFVDW